MSFSAGKETLALATAAWGKPTVIKETGGDVNVWFNPGGQGTREEGIIRVLERDAPVVRPGCELLGRDKAGPAFQKAHPLIGLTPDDVRKHYATNLLETSAAKNAATLAAAQKFAGTKVDLGASKASVDLVYPPTEYGSFETKVNLYFDKGKVKRYTFGVDYEPFPQQKTDVLALLMKTYGAPKKGKDFGQPVLVFRKAPAVKVEDDTIMKRWAFTVEK